MNPTTDSLLTMAAATLLLMGMSVLVTQPAWLWALWPLIAILTWRWLTQDLDHSPNARSWFTTAALVALCLWLSPALSNDHYRYLWEGYVQNMGFSPYRHAPQELFPLLDHPDEAGVNHAHLTAIYPPLAQLAFRMADASTWGLWFWKTLLLVSLALTGWFTGVRSTWLVLAAPMVLVEGFWNAHVDVLGLAPAILMVWALNQKRPRLVGIALAMITAIKLIPLIWLPLCWRHFSGRKRWSLLFAFTLTLALCYLPFVADAAYWFDSFQTFSSAWYFNNPIFHGLAALNGQDYARIAMGLLLGCSLIVVFFQNRPVAWQCVAAWLAVITFSPTVYPWYLVWLLPFFVVGDMARSQAGVRGRRWVGLAYLAASLSYGVLFDYLRNGDWQERFMWMIPEWILMGLCFVGMLRALDSVPATHTTERKTHDPTP